MAASDSTAKPAKSKTDQAIAYMEITGMTAYAVAPLFDVPASAIYKRVKLLATTADQRCKCCGQLLKS